MSQDVLRTRFYDGSRDALDPSALKLGPEEIAFFEAQTGITDEEELRKHIIDVQAEAFAVSDTGSYGFRETRF